MKGISTTFAGCTVLFLAISACGGPVPERAASPGDSCCREFDYVLEVTIFKIDVVRLNLRIDSETARTVSTLIAGRPRTPSLEDSVAAAFLEASRADARMTFLRGMSGQQFLDNTVGALSGMGAEGLLTSEEVERLVRSSRQRFEFLYDFATASSVSGPTSTLPWVT